MKILLVGEFSGVHNNLKRGLISLGHEVKIASDGDKFKKFRSDIKIAPYKSKYVGKILNILFFIFNIRKFIGYDVVQFISPFVFPYYYHYIGLSQFVLLTNKKTFYYVCGTDPAFLNSRSKFKYFPFDNTSSIEYPNFDRRKKKWYYSWFIKNVDYIVPSMYEYYLGYSKSPKLLSPIQLPGSGRYVNEIKPIDGKIKILFGIIRRDFKGADTILHAIQNIKRKFGNKVKVNIVEKVPFDVYIKFLQQADILIDQCKSYSYGMNAIVAMEKGVIVLSGSEQIAMRYTGIKNTAVINIKPDVSQIESVLESLLTNASKIISLKNESIIQSRKYHNPLLIASLFVDYYKII